MHKLCIKMFATLLLAGCTGTALANDSDIAVSQFNTASEKPPAPWQLIQMDKKIAPTQYHIIQWDNRLAIEAIANNSMALLARPLEIDLQRTPTLCWRWRVDAPLKSADMTRKSGDDYAARVYVAFRLPPESMSFMTRTKLKLARSIYGTKVPDAAINYVWDNNHAVGTSMPNAYTDRAQMMVLQTGAAKAGSWVTEQRDLLADAQAGFGTDQVQAILLAVASDTDNTKESAHAGFADLHFVARGSQCHF